MTASPDRLITSSAEVRTDAPARYAKQLVAHLGRKVEFTERGDTSTAVIGGATAEVVVGEGLLTLRASGSDETAVSTVEHVLGSHLERFGQRQELTVTWVRSPT